MGEGGSVWEVGWERGSVRWREGGKEVGGEATLLFYVFSAETCPKCEHSKAYFVQMQTRSADEPMTIFYKCCNKDCNHRWKE